MKRTIIGMAGALLLGLAGADAQAGSGFAKCYDIAGASIDASAYSEGCESAVGLCTAGVTSGHKLLAGTQGFVAEEMASAAGLAGEEESVLSYNGTVRIVTPRGTLLAQDVGVFDTAEGLFASRSLILGGTGIFRGASGYLLQNGVGFSSFHTDLRGEVCLASPVRF